MRLVSVDRHRALSSSNHLKMMLISGVSTGISILPAPDGPFIHQRVAEPTKILFAGSDALPPAGGELSEGEDIQKETP